MMRAGLAGIAALIFSAGAAMAQTPPAPPDDNRYRLEKTQTGFVRLDQQTGAVSFCREEAGGLTCRMAADERTAFEQELDMLTKRVEALEKSSAGPAGRPAGPPSEAEIEQSLSIMERFMRRFMGLIEEFREEDRPSPDRT
jgi:hypothetical protein